MQVDSTIVDQQRSLVIEDLVEMRTKELKGTNFSVLDVVEIIWINTADGTGACFSCGEMGHRVGEGPKRDLTRDKNDAVKGTLATLLGPNYGRVYQHQPKHD